MNSVAMFLTTGASHSANLAVALHTLRRHWDGEIWVYAFEDSYKWSKQIASDPRINAEAWMWFDPIFRGKNEQEISKIDIIQTDPALNCFDSVIYLDADLIFAGDISPLAKATEDKGFVATQFCNWNMDGGIARNRVSKLIGINGIDQECVQKALQPHLPSYNTGVFASVPGHPMLETWGHWSYLARHIYISGETAIHAAAQKHDITTWYGGRYNCSTMKYQPKELADKDVVIWHGHGDSFNRPDKSPKGTAMWLAELQLCLDQNIGGIQDWINDVPNKHLKRLRAMA